MNFPTLYKQAKKGRIQEWTVSTDKEKIVTIHGVLRGSLQETTKIAKGKNIGRANETSPDKQAELQAQSMWNKKKDKGYFESEHEAINTQVFLPMLAHDFEKHKKKVQYPAFIQPKLDGTRCLAYWEDNEIKLLSRGGKHYNVPHISKALESILLKDTVFDGELYLHGATFQQVTKLVKKYRPQQTEELKLWIYDVFKLDNLNQPFESRLIMLDALNLHVGKSCIGVQITPTEIVESEALAYDIQKEYLELGFEGAILRAKDLPYELAERSMKLLKIKSFMDAEYIITGYTEGEGKFERCVIWICATKDNKSFKVVPKGTIEDKKGWFKDAKDHIGSWLKVKYFELTDDGIPRFPVGIGIREPEDMDDAEWLEKPIDKKILDRIENKDNFKEW